MQANLVKQLAKLLKVRYVEDVTSARRVGARQRPPAPRSRCTSALKQPDGNFGLWAPRCRSAVILPVKESWALQVGRPAAGWLGRQLSVSGGL